MTIADLARRSTHVAFIVFNVIHNLAWPPLGTA